MVEGGIGSLPSCSRKKRSQAKADRQAKAEAESKQTEKAQPGQRQRRSGALKTHSQDDKRAGRAGQSRREEM